MSTLLISHATTKSIVFAQRGLALADKDTVCGMLGLVAADHIAQIIEADYTTLEAQRLIIVDADDQVQPLVKTTDELKAEAYAKLAAYRWQQETGGYTYNSWPVHSDDRSQFKALAEILRIQSAARTDGDVWKFADGQFRALTNSEFLLLYAAGESHVKNCFICEALCQARIAGGEYDIKSIWAEEWASLTII